MAVSLGVVAGAINAGVVLLQLTFPLLAVSLLVAFLPSENNAITWSVVGRQLQGSFWPLILSADSTSSTKVKTRVLVFSASSTLGLLLLAVAAVVTPLGLYATVTEGITQNVTFVYARDMSPIGQATVARSNYTTSRLCPGFTLYYNCPGQDHGFSFFNNASGSFVQSNDDDAYISSIPPRNLSEVFGSGRTGELSTVASALDIQYRSYVRLSSQDETSGSLSTRLKMKVDQDRPRSVGRFFIYQSYILADDYVIVDGIIADMKNGGIGFRNHTIPATIDQGAEWTESILWLEPESVCINTNLTYQWNMSANASAMTNTRLVDNGGFAELPLVPPVLDLNETQRDPKLIARATRGAVLFNENLMRFLNISRNSSTIGRAIRMPDRLSNKHGYLGIDRFGVDGATLTFLGDPLYGPPLVNNSYPYHPIFSSIQGIYRDNITDISRITADGGILLGMPVGSDGSIAYRDIPGVTWNAPLYSCVSTVKTYLKDVTFSVNGTKGLSSLAVKSTMPRQYSSSTAAPLWAVEDTGFNVLNISPLWGLVDDKYERASRLGTVRKDALYLPASRTQYLNRPTFINLNQDDAWGPGAPQAALGMVYGCALGGRSCLESLPDYTGKTSYSAFLKWSELTKSPTASAKIISLIYTDIMINLVTSSRSRLTITNTESANFDLSSISAPAVLSSATIKYRLPFAIPAIIFLLFYLVILIAFFLLLCFRRTTISTIRSLTNQTAVGRAVTIERYHDRHDVKMMSTKAWIEIHGDANLPLSKSFEFTKLSTNVPEDDGSNNDIEMTSLLVPGTAKK